MDRLIVFVTLSQEQARATDYLMNTDGLCTCGQPIYKADNKFIMSQINTAECPVPKMRNTLIIAAYCEDCYIKINTTIRLLKPRTQEPRQN